jgi:hypothetical protein
MLKKNSSIIIMDIYGKSLVYTVFLIILLLVIQRFIPETDSGLEPSSSQENFVNLIGSTIIDDMIPNEGDSSTLVKLTGAGFKYVSKIYFKLGKTLAQAIILDNRTDLEIQIIPPPISELGKTLADIRKSIKDTKRGLPVSIVFIRGTKDDDGEYIDLVLNEEDSNMVEVENLFFYYIDKLPYQNNCAVPPEAPAPTVEEETEELPDRPPVAYNDGSDLEFLNKILPEREKKLQEVYNSILKNLNSYNELGTKEQTELQTMQALESLEEVKKQFNYERYVIHQELSKN